MKIQELSDEFEQDTYDKTVEVKKAWFLQKVAEHEVIFEVRARRLSSSVAQS